MAALAHPVEFVVVVAAVVIELLMDVAPGREGAAGTGQHDATDPVVRLQFFQRIVQLTAELAVHRVELLGAVQGQDADAVFGIDQDVFVFHHFLLQRFTSPHAT